MGLDISVGVDKPDNLDELYNNWHNELNTYGLSRAFCNLMFRENSAYGETELDQIGRITGLDMAPFNEMNDEDTGADINTVINLTDKLLEALQNISNLPELIVLDEQDYDLLNIDTYFADLNKEDGSNYLDNNITQDLRNLRRFLLYAREHEIETIYFKYM